jgi:hypothetical protein
LGIPDVEGNLVPGRRLEISPGYEDHAIVQVEGVQPRGVKFRLEEAGAGPPTAADLQDPGLGFNPGHASDPLDDQALDYDPPRVIDDEPLGPVDLQGFTPR